MIAGILELRWGRWLLQPPGSQYSTVVYDMGACKSVLDSLHGVEPYASMKRYNEKLQQS